MVFDYRFHNLLKMDVRKADWTIIASLVPSTLLMNGCTKAFFQSWGKAPGVKRLFKYNTLKIQIGRNDPLTMVVLPHNSNNRFLGSSNCR